MRTRHGEEDLVVDDGWIGSSQLDMTEPEQPTPNSYAPRAPCPQPQALRNELHCTTLRRDEKRCDVMQRTRNCQRLAAGASRGARPSQIAPTLGPALLSFGEVKPSPIKRLLVLCALIVAPLPQQQYDRPTWWRRCHLDVNWQKRSRNRNFGRDEWQMCAQVRRCAVLAAPDRRVASISKIIRCGQGSLRERERARERDASRHVMWSCTRTL